MRLKEIIIRILFLFVFFPYLEAQNMKIEETLQKSQRNIFVLTSSDSKVKPDDDVWVSELNKYPEFSKVKEIDKAEYIFEFFIKRALGESRVKVKVFNQINGEILWESKKYRGTTNAFNGMSPTKHGIRKCFEKGILPAFKKGEF
ncbi:hypothetical protein FEE95_08595 [Maribacter algarum]|uniref:Uncharacterized protein n=1 Tax=Maribacter algarum (ex Zhang et al. 2020) TaxID=2578118 RepID=A0A5S3Q1J5_9FLAO|nr:hypothetical protein [Maribacter algarum]TMM59467.1 hypothetical protein FEE95_08595 [Maribacter algarum]